MSEHREHKEKYSDSQKAKFMVEEAKLKTLQGRKIESIASLEDVAFNEHPIGYIEVCNRFKGGNVKLVLN